MDHLHNLHSRPTLGHDTQDDDPEVSSSSTSGPGPSQVESSTELSVPASVSLSLPRLAEDTPTQEAAGLIKTSLRISCRGLRTQLVCYRKWLSVQLPILDPAIGNVSN